MITCQKFEFIWKRRFMTLMTIYRPTQGLYKKKKRKSKRRTREQEKGNKLRPYLACIDGLYQWSRWCVTGRLHHRLTMPGASNIVSWLYQTCQSQHTPGHISAKTLLIYDQSRTRTALLPRLLAVRFFQEPGASTIVSWLYQTCQSQHTRGHHLCQNFAHIWPVTHAHGPIT